MVSRLALLCFKSSMRSWSRAHHVAHHLLVRVRLHALYQ